MPKKPSNSAGPELSYGSCSEKRLRSDGSALVLSVTCKKINMLTIFVSTNNIFKKTYSARNQGSITEAKMKPKEKVVNVKYLFTLHVGNSQVLMSTS